MHGTDLLLSCASETQLRPAEIPGFPASPSQLASLWNKIIFDTLCSACSVLVPACMCTYAHMQQLGGFTQHLWSKVVLNLNIIFFNRSHYVYKYSPAVSWLCTVCKYTAMHHLGGFDQVQHNIICICLVHNFMQLIGFTWC